MDEELPLFMYLTSQLNIKNLVAELRLIEDYLVNGRSIDKESKVLTNLLVIYINIRLLLNLYHRQVICQIIFI
jgi:hypothetical protein